nr:phosphoinositide 3-kinase regulatory subunit 5-like [Nerophis lumbriciformis]
MFAPRLCPHSVTLLPTLNSLCPTPSTPGCGEDKRGVRSLLSGAQEAQRGTSVGNSDILWSTLRTARSRGENLWLSVREVVKKQCPPKSKKSTSLQHVSITGEKVNKVEVSSGTEGQTFAVCLDQDQRKFLQSVSRLEVSLCCKPGSWKLDRQSPGQVRPLHPSYCSLLCLPVVSFSAAYP